MANSEWDKHLRDILGDFKSEGEAPHWDEFAQQLDANSLDSPISDPLTDESLKSQLANYSPPVAIEGWERIESILDQQHKEFDKNVREKVQQYGPQYDPLSWPVFLKRLTDNRRLRIQLIALKTIEFGAILLFMLTVVNMGRLGKFPFDVPAAKDPNTIQHSNQNLEDRAYLDNQNNSKDNRTGIQTQESPDQNVNSGLIAGHEVNFHSPTERSSASPRNQKFSSHGIVLTESDRYTKTQDPAYRIDPPGHSSQLNLTASQLLSHPNTLTGVKPNPQNLKDEVESSSLNEHKLQFSLAADMLASLPVHIDHTSTNPIPPPKFVRQLKRTYLEFGMLTQADFNRLRMPEDRLFSAGKEIVFPEQGIPSHGFGGGFTIALGHPLWALETGIIYSAKDFEPGRQLIVGGAFDNGSVEFEAMRLQLVSVPIQYRYRFDNKGKLKAYGLAGFGLHVIARSDIDVLIKYHFPSLSAGENPNNNPALAQTIRETRRIREHIRDGAPFSSKSFFSANAGLGLEYNITPHKILFLQTAIQYQIPNLRFSNNNGKNIQSVSVQAGVRTPLGI